MNLGYKIYHEKDADLSNPSGDPLVVYYGVLGLEEGSFKYGNSGGKLEIHLAGRNTTAVMVDSDDVPPSRRQHFLA